MILFCIVSLIVIGNYVTESAYIDFLCPDPEPIVNGSHNGDCIGNFPPGVNVTYACDYGYGMEGPKSRICRIIEPSDPYSRPIARWEPQEPPVCKRLIPCRVFCFGHAECFIKDGKMACACQPGSFWTPIFNSCQVDSEIYCHIIFSAKPYVKEIVDNVIETLQKRGIEQAVLELVSHRKGISRCFSTKEKKENTAEIDKVVKSMISSGQKIHLAIIVFLRSIIDEEQSKADMSKVMEEIGNDPKYTKNEKDLIKELHDLIGRKCLKHGVLIRDPQSG